MSLGYAEQEALAAWDREVGAEMVRLIESGTPPYDAASQARDIVSNRRREKASRGHSHISEKEQ